MAIYEKLMGNPFVDAGVSAICEWLGPGTQPEEIKAEDLHEVIRQVAPMYCQPEYRTQIRFIFPNSPVTQHREIQRGMESLINKIKSDWFHCLDRIADLGLTGDCAGCGRRNVDFQLKKTEVPLSGSGAFRNFFPLFADGVGYCAACALAIQFIPLSLISSGGKFLMLHSNIWRVQKKWSHICVSDIQSRAAQNDFTGCFNPRYTNPRNGLFYMTSLLIDYEERHETEDVAMQIFYFSNDNRGAELEIFHLPVPVFRFLRYAYQSNFRQSWKQIVRSGWDRVESEEDYKKKNNRVYERLLQGQSILGFFLNRSARKARSNWELLSLYLKEVRNMEESRLNAIKQVGDFIAESIRKTEKNGRLIDLERARGYPECRNVLLFVIRDRIRQGEETPLFSLDDYVKDLFPEPRYWRETRDLLVFRIYETLHEWLVTGGFVDDVEDETDQFTDESQEEI